MEVRLNIKEILEEDTGVKQILVITNNYSVVARDLFFKLKAKGYSCELVDGCRVSTTESIVYFKSPHDIKDSILGFIFNEVIYDENLSLTEEMANRLKSRIRPNNNKRTYNLINKGE